ncbi:sensor protein KdpD [Solitalea sp. MAHUQ-68]|uniref:Sensor protein KdpD n=1 Tax=Solitalea agri TaxID=2953739 RepID=A0A9X2F4Z4_9SPHI|nr:sensor protein KdpD [Solitalea agri]MCO4294289.1 sensor protein KdpD [Solitalea agri]
MPEKDQTTHNFLNLIRQPNRGKFKIYIGMSAGVGKTYRMLQEAHALLKSGIEVKIGYVETHRRAETEALLQGLPIVPRRKLFYKGKELEEMDLQAILNLHPEVVIVDELAHSNIEGSKNPKRWQDVVDILNAGINVISAVNIQHLESLNEDVEKITTISITERIPDSMLLMADEVVNIDLTAEELVTRLREGKIYEKAKIETALGNFFQSDKILQLRELALKEVANQVTRKVETEVPKNIKLRKEVFLACISTNDKSAKNIIRKTARLAAYYRSTWMVLYVQRSVESVDRIKLDAQRHLINNFKLATELGAEVIREKNDDRVEAMIAVCTRFEVTTICMGKPHFNFFARLTGNSFFNRLMKHISEKDIDVVILS